MKKESFTLFMKQVAVDLQQSGNLGTAHVYRSSLNAILVFQESESVEFREITPELVPCRGRTSSSPAPFPWRGARPNSWPRRPAP